LGSAYDLDDGLRHQVDRGNAEALSPNSSADSGPHMEGVESNE
jgi:hypothetical protein